MDMISSISTIDQKMAEMRIKNLELLKRHQEIEEDRQLAQQSTTTSVESTKDTILPTTTMRGTTKHRGRYTANQQNSQENQHERMHRPPPVRRKFENDRTDIQPQRAQRVDYNRLKRERAHEATNQQQTNNSINPELLEYAYPFHYRSDHNNDADEPAHAKKLVIINNQAGRIGSGRFNQPQRPQEQGQHRQEDRMRRYDAQNNGHHGGASEFHLDVPQMPMWQNGSMPPPTHVQLLPQNINGHHTGIDHYMNNGEDQMEQSAYLHNFVYPSPVQTSPYNGNDPVYFAHPPMPPGSSSSSSQAHFHQYHPTRTFENSNRHQFHHPPDFQLPPPQSPTPHNQQQQQDPSVDLPPRFRHLKNSDYSNQRPMSGDFERLHISSSRFNHDNRFQSRPQSFYDFSSQQYSNNNNFSRSTNNNNNRYQRNNNNNLPLSAYMNTDDSSYQNENNNYWGTSSNQKRRTYHQDKHQFPLSSYDPRQYGLSRPNHFNNRSNQNRRYVNNLHHNEINNSNDIDLIEEWWEDNNTELIGINNIDSQATTIDDSGNSSLSTSMHLKESILDDDDDDDEDKNSMNPSSDSNIIESLEKLQEELKFEEDVEKRLELENDLLSSDREPATYDTAHFMQWAKEKFREELAGRLTAQEIEQHDAETTDDEDDNILLPAAVHTEEYYSDQTTDEDIDNHMEKLEDDLNGKLTIDENPPTKSIVVQ